MMKNISCKIISACTIGIFAMILPSMAWADTFYKGSSYISTSRPNSTLVHSDYLLANVNVRDDTTFTAITMSWEIKSGDAIKIQWWDKDLNSLGTSQVSGGTSTRMTLISYPSNAYAGKIVLETGSADGYRCVWWKSCENSKGHLTIFDDPDLSGGQERSEANNDIRKIRDYITTPRAPTPIQPPSMPSIDYDTTPIQPPSMPSKTINPEPPTISEPYQPPYEYDRPEPSVPDAQQPPEPLPYNPDPSEIPHDDPTPPEEPTQPNDPTPVEPPVDQDPPGNIDPPLTPDPPGIADPVEMEPVLPIEPPKDTEPVEMEPPATVDPPGTMDPVQMDPPGTRDPVTIDPPLQPDTPYGGNTPYLPQDPYNRETPLTRQPPD